MVFIHRWFTPPFAPVALITLLGAVLRFHDIGLIEHNVDHAYPIWQALMTLDHGVWPLLGQGTSVLFANPPLTGYLYLPLLALFRSPVAVYAAVISLNTLAIPLAYAALRPLIGMRAALLAALLVAVNPWVIEYSRTSWVQSLLPFFACLLAWLLFPLLTSTSVRPGRRMVGLGVAVVVAVNTYLLAYLFLAQIGVLLALFWRSVPKRALVAALLIVLVPALIYGVALWSQPDVTARLERFGGAGLHVSAEALSHALRLVSGADYPLVRGIDAPEPFAGAWPLLVSLSAALGWLVVAVLVAGLVRAARSVVRRDEQRRAGLILLVWFLLPPLAMTAVSQVVHPFYLLLTLPAGAGLAGWGADGLLTSVQGSTARRATTAVAGVLLALFVVVQASASTRYYAETAALPGAHGLGALPLEQGLALGAMLNDALPTGGTVLADVDEWTLSSFAGRTFPFLREARASQFTLLPARGGVIVAAQAAETPLIVPQGSTGQSSRVLADGVTLTVDTLPAAPALPAEAIPLAVPGEQGIALEGWSLADEGGGQYTLQTWWRVTNLAGAADRLFAPFAHVFNPSGERIAVVDGAAVPGYLWSVGDLHVHRMSFHAEAPFTLAVGQFDGGAGENVIFVLPDGTYSALIPLDVES